jgi:hypothetical protein
MSQQGGSSEIEDYPRSQRIFPGWSTVWKVGGVLLVLAAGVLYLGREVARQQLKFWAQSTGKSLAIAASLYAFDYDEVLPSAHNWESTLDPYWREEREVESNAWFWDGRKTRFAMNENLSGVRMKTIKDPSVVPIFFLSTLPGPSAVGGTQDVAYNEHGYALVSSLDSGSRGIQKEDVERLQWTVPVKSPSK